ncbi:MAG: aspartate aminotransferase family protein [Thermodesulfobacteriota bacterium]
MKPIGPEAIRQKKKSYLLPCLFHFYQHPPQIVKGERQYLIDHEGRPYLDFYAGVAVVNAGHCHPEITEKTCAQIRTLQHTTTIYLTQPIVDMAEKVAAIAPAGLDKCFFCNSGSEANDGALILARLATGRHGTISLTHGLHGRTYLTLSVTGIPMWRTDNAPYKEAMLIPGPNCYRCHFQMRYPTCDVHCARNLEKAITPDTAAFIAEPVAGNGGIIVPPPEYFPIIREITRKAGILFICDEVQTGINRTGKMFAIEHWGVTPDILTMAKALGNGVPVGAYVTTAAIAAAHVKPGASTLGGNPVTAATVMATLEVHEKERLQTRAHSLGLYFKEQLKALQEKYPIIGDVRGIGLMLGAELVKTDGSADAETCDRILESMKDDGVLIGKTGIGRNVLTFQPPLIVTKDNIDEVLGKLDSALMRNHPHAS